MVLDKAILISMQAGIELILIKGYYPDIQCVKFYKFDYFLDNIKIILTGRNGKLKLNSMCLQYKQQYWAWVSIMSPPWQTT